MARRKPDDREVQLRLIESRHELARMRRACQSALRTGSLDAIKDVMGISDKTCAICGVSIPQRSNTCGEACRRKLRRQKQASQ